MKPRPQQSHGSQGHFLPFCVVIYLWNVAPFREDFQCVFFGYSPSLCGPFAYQSSAIPSDNHTSEIPIFRVTSSIGRVGLLDAGEMQTVWMRIRTFSCLLFLLFQSKAALQVSYLSTGQKLCSVLPLDSYTELLKGFFQLHFFVNLPETFTSYYFRTYRVRVNHYILPYSCLCLNNITLHCLALPFYLFPFLWYIWTQQYEQQMPRRGLGGSHW